MRYAEITYDQVIASAKMMLQLQNTTDHDPFFLLMADEAMRSIDDLKLYEFQTKDLPLTDGTAPLPCGFMRVMAVWFTDANGRRCTPAPYIQRNIANWCDCDTSGCPSLGTSFQLNGNHIVFSNPSAIDATEVTMAYLGIRMDENNMPIIPESHLRAVRAYLIYRYSEMMAPSLDNAQKSQMLYNLGSKSYREFVNQKKGLQADANVALWQENKKISGARFDAWITSPLNQTYM